MRSPRQHRIDRAIVRVLASLGDLVLPDNLLREEVGLHLVPAPTTAELDDAIHYADTQRRIAGIATETGIKWQITDAGKIWNTQNR